MVFFFLFMGLFPKQFKTIWEHSIEVVRVSMEEVEELNFILLLYNSI